MQGDFFITNSALPSVAGITALHCGRLVVVANAALNLQRNTLFKKKKTINLKKQPAQNLDNNFTKDLDSFLSKKFTTKLLYIIIITEKKADATPEVPPATFKVPAAPNSSRLKRQN